MSPQGSENPDPPWLQGVLVSEDRARQEELLDRFLRGSGLKAVSVSDLLAPRRAFWRRFGARVPPSVERQARLDAGRAWHRQVGSLIAAEGSLEVRLRRGGVSARVDLLADVPVEIKTSDRAAPGDLVRERPEYAEQLAMYCALLRRPSGRLVHLGLSAGRPSEVRAVDVSFNNVETLATEVGRRETELRASFTAGRPTSLPRCAWFGRGCEFEGSVCDCTGEEPTPSSALLEGVDRTSDRPDIASRWSHLLAAEPTLPNSPTIGRFRELVYPRRAYFDRTTGPPPAEGAPPPADTRTPDLYDRTVEAIESGPAGEVALLPSNPEAPEEDVVGWRGRPFLLRTSRAWERIDPERSVSRFPQYAIELGFRCLATGQFAGDVIVAYERAERDADRFQVISYDFHASAPAFASLWRERGSALSQALARGSPIELPPCPGWMYSDCPYRGECACGAEPARSHR